MTPQIKKFILREETERIFGISLSNEYQCGSCYKCAEEQVISSRFHGRNLPKKYLRYCESLLIDKCVFENHNINGFVPYEYLKKIGIKSIFDLIGDD